MTDTPISPAPAGALTHRRFETGYVDWSSIFAGTTIAVAMALLLITFGSAIGLSVASPWTSSGPVAETVGIGAVIWVALVQIYTAGAGAYFASRLRPRTWEAATREEVLFRDGANGLAVWALSLLISVLLAVSIASGLIRAGASAASAVAGGAAGATGLITDRTITLLAGSEENSGASGAAEQSLPRSLSPENRADLQRVVASILSQGRLQPQDRAYLEGLLARYTGSTPAEAARRVKTAMDSALAEARDITEAARRAAATTTFLTTLAFLLAGIAAWWAATLGGEHRDRGTGLLPTSRSE